MESLKKHQPFFTKFGSTFSSVVSSLIGRPVIVEPLQTELVTREQLVSRVSQQGVIVSTAVREPKPGIVILFMTRELGVMLPELLVNPSAVVAPEKLSALHRSAMEEMMSQVWSAAGDDLASHFRSRFSAQPSEIGLAVLDLYMTSLPAFTGIKDFVLSLSRVSIEGAASGLLAQIYPASFWAAPAARKPADLTPLEKLPLEHIDKAAAEKPKKPPAARPDLKKTVVKGPFRERNIKALADVPMEVTAEIGRTRMSVGEILGLKPGAIIELDRDASQPIEVKMGSRIVARGQVVLIDSQKFGVRVTRILSPDDRLDADGSS